MGRHIEVSVPLAVDEPHIHDLLGGVVGDFRNRFGIDERHFLQLYL